MQEIINLAVTWAERQAQYGSAMGRPVTSQEIQLAEKVGVSTPEKIRILEVENIPKPVDPFLVTLCDQYNFLTPNTIGLTLGYVVLIKREYKTAQLLSHEFRHVHQYERYGSIAEFLSVYIEQILTLGYESAPLEQDARVHEIKEWLS